MKRLTINQRLYQFVERNSRLELEYLRKEAAVLKNKIDDNEQKLAQQKEKIATVSSRMNLKENNHLDIGWLNQNRLYLVSLQEELSKHQLIAKSLAKRHSVQLSRMRMKYQEAKLYEKMNKKNMAAIANRLEKIEEKQLEEIANQSNIRSVGL